MMTPRVNVAMRDHSNPPPSKLKSLGSTQFAVDLFKAVAKQIPATENVVLWPFSVEYLLAMLYSGAQGDTQRELSQLLRLNDCPFEELLAVLQMVTSNPKNLLTYKLDIANGVFVDECINLRPEYFNTSTISNSFHDNIQTVPFHASEEHTCKFINKFTEAKTGGQITKSFAPGDIPPSIDLLLHSAVFFKAQWEDPFLEHNSQRKTFTLADGSTKEITYLCRHPWDQYYKYEDGTEIIKLSQEGYIGKVIVILPPEGTTLAELEETLSVQRLRQFLDERRSDNYMRIQVPKFRIESEVDLTPALKSMGASELLGPNPDLSGMSYRDGITARLWRWMEGADRTMCKQKVVIGKAYVGKAYEGAGMIRA